LGEKLTGRQLHADLSKYVAYSDHLDIVVHEYEHSPLDWELLTVDEANKSISVVQNAIVKVSKERANIGAFQNRR
ncbi:MAG: hypothetical protein HC905_06950, partial [Bacteroidales bacterium]|nr:hypothetical protein [Bacteroidales bacterium]